MQQLMQPACAPIGFLPGDTFDLSIRLWSDGGGGARVPPTIAPGEVFSLTLGRIVCTTADAGPLRLLTVVDQDGVHFDRQFSPLETGRFGGPGGGQPLAWSFARVPVPGNPATRTPAVRRTYVEGPINLVQPTGCGLGDRIIEVTVTEGGVVVDIGPVPDPASYTDAREAAIRQDQAAADQVLKMRAFGAALLF